MARKVTTLSIRDDAAHLLVTQGKQVKRWGSLRLEPGLITQGLVADEEKVASKLREFFHQQKIPAKRVRVALSGYSSLCRVISLPELPDSFLLEAVKHEAGRVLPISLEDVYLLYKSVPSCPGEMRLFLVAVRRGIADAMLRTLRLADIKLAAMELAPLALCQLVDEPRAIIVDASLEHLDMVIVDDGLPQLVHTPSLAGETETENERVAALADELNRAIAFYNSSHPEQQEDSTIPLYICGELSERPGICESLAEDWSHPADIRPPVEAPVDFPLNRFAVNLGLGARKSRGVLPVNLDLLPVVRHRRGVPLAQIIAGISIAGGAAFLLYTGAFVHDSAAYTETLRSQVIPIERLVVQERTEIANLKAQGESLEAERLVLDSTLADLAVQRENISRGLERVVNLLPLEVELTGASHRADGVTVRGTARDEAGVFTYARNLRDSDQFSSVDILSIEEETGEAELFNFSVLLDYRRAK